jgi:hypothetical protein
MALQFLTMAAQAAPAVMQILGAIKGNSKPKIQPMPESERYAISMLKALSDPDNSLVEQLSDREFQTLRGAQQSDIRSKVLADRREGSMGRAPVFFDPERADENINYQISRGTPMLKQQSQQNAIQRILQAAGVGNYAAAESDRMQNYYAAMGENKKGEVMQGGILGRLGQGNDALQQILKIFQSQSGPKQQAYGPPSTLYNQMRYNA